MKKAMVSALFLLGLTAAAEMNLFRNDGFKPVVMRGEKTAPYGWWCLDEKRYLRNTLNRDGKNEYISGYKCFKLSFSPGSMTIFFPENAPADYYKLNANFHIYNQSCTMPELAATQYRIRGEYKLNKGTFGLLTLKPYPATGGQWKKFDATVSAELYNSRRIFLLLNFKPLPGLELSLRDFHLEPVYPPSKADFIRLPNGGKLTSLTLPEKASFELRYLAALWQSWLWRLTGVVLPIKEGGPGKNSFVFRKADLPEGSWKIKVDTSGGELLYEREATLWPALREYLRKAGVIYYAKDCRKVPEPKADLVLPAIDKTVNPRFHRMLNGYNYGATQWTYCRAGVDWFTYHYPEVEHFMNTLLPMDLYREKHPEYFMMMEDGTRQKVRNPYLMTPCMTNPEVRKIITENFGDLVRASGYCDRSSMLLGDRPTFCHCPECRKNGDSYSDIMLDMANRMARKAAEIRPDFKVQCYAYLKTHDVPKTVKPEPNVLVMVTMPPYSNPCNVHVDCPENRKALDHLIGWSKLAGPDRVGVMNYEEERPFHYLKRLEFYNRYAKAGHYVCSRDPQIFYIAERWNMGEDGEQAIREFNDAYFGAGGKYVTQIQRMVEDFCEKYQHRPGEVSSPFYNITVMSWVFNRNTILPRELFDRIYAAFDRAFAAVGEKDSPERNHLLLEKYKFLRMDLAKYRYTDCGSDAEVKAFAGRLRDFIGICSKLIVLNPQLQEIRIWQDTMNGAPARYFLQMTAGIVLPTTRRDWTQEPALKEVLKNLEKHLTLKPQSIPGGTLFMPGVMRGGVGPMDYGDRCPRKLCKLVRRPSSGTGSIAMLLKLEKKPESPLLLVTEGLDDDKPGASTMEISVNGKVIFSGANTYEEHNWTKMSFTIPAECLKAGDNRIQLRNTVSDRREKARDDGGIYIGQSGIQDYTWGWICISRIHVLDMSGEFRKFLSGGNGAWKKFPGQNKPEGVIEVRDGVLHMQSKGAPITAVYFPTPQRDDRIALKAGETIRCTLEGSGVVGFGFWSYDLSGKFNKSEEKSGIINTVKPGKASFTVTLPEKSATASIVPFIRASLKGGTVTNIYYEIIRPQPGKASSDKK